jgi:Fe/S biogenesis protein NfuA
VASLYDDPLEVCAMANSEVLSESAGVTVLDDPGASPILSVTPAARSVVGDARGAEPDPSSLALWVEVTGARGGAYTYDIYFQALRDATDEDVVHDDGDLPVVVPLKSVARLRGARLDWSDEGEGGLVILNPNSPPKDAVAPPAPVGDLSSQEAQRILAVLESEVNPAIAAHGGRADLVAFEEGVAYLRLSGGCQGCGMAKATLQQGIEVSLREAVPEIIAVRDVTDHAGGTNPYFEGASA